MHLFTRARAGRLTALLLLAALVLYAVRGHVQLPVGQTIVDDYLYNGLLIAGAALCLLRGAAVRADRGAWLLVGAGLAAWASADLYRTVLLAQQEALPYPSTSDLGWLVYYPTMYVAVILLMRARGVHVERGQWLDGLIAGLATAALVIALLFPQILAAGLEGTPAAVAVNLAYPVGDLLLLCLLVGTYGVMGWHVDRTWLWLGVGVATSGVADLGYLYTVAGGSYQEGNWLSPLWPASALATACAAWQPSRRTKRRHAGSLRLLVVPGAFTLAAFGVLVWDHFEPVGHVAAGAAALALLVAFLRMFLTFQEYLTFLRKSRIEAATDPLTGLGNRRRLSLDLEHTLRQSAPDRPSVLLLFDLNGFKTYNDTFGHPAGDAILCRLGQDLSAAVAPDGAAYRMGGDEFCVLAPLPDGDDATVVLACLGALSQRGERFNVSAAYGACLLVDPTLESSDALRRADRAMYAQKDSTRLSAGGQSMEVLVRVTAERDGQLGDHTSDVAALCELVAEHLGLGTSERSAIQRAGVLHDVGKAAIPDAILHKPGPLDEDEWAFMRRHTIIGERILLGAPALGDVAALVRSSHERFDGNGYPDGLAGEDIPLGARIVAVCDAFDAMVCERPYARQTTPAEALEELERCAGTQFDPVVVTAFASVYRARSATATDGLPVSA